MKNIFLKNYLRKETQNQVKWIHLGSELKLCWHINKLFKWFYTGFLLCGVDIGTVFAMRSNFIPKYNFYVPLKLIADYSTFPFSILG